MTTDSRLAPALEEVLQAAQNGRITPSASENIRNWLTQTRYADYQSELLDHIEKGAWQKLDDVFWTVIPFGTGGRRGRMYPIGSNAINDRTIGESAQGLASYILGLPEPPKRLSCAIAYDTRHRSRHFAELCAGIMVANGFHVYLLDDYRATPQLSFAVRHFECTCGIMVTASHNPPSDNAVKVYWSTGGQVLPPHDANIIDQVMNVDKIERTPFAQAVADGHVTTVTAEVDRAYQNAVLSLASPGSRRCKIVFSPLHGVGGFVVPPLLRAAGFDNVLEFAPQSKPDGDFPNVPGHVSNPENPAVFESIVEFAQTKGADLVLATDPDCDRMGCSCPKTTAADSHWGTLNGNQLGALLTDFVLSKHKATGKLNDASFVVKTLVTSELTRRIAESYGVRCEGNIHVGFKWIAEVVDRCGPDHFVFGTEESHGYLAGQHVRDKDAGVACLLMAELAAELKERGITPHQRLDELLSQHGVFVEDQINVQMEGSEGMVNMQRVMESLRRDPPESIGGLSVIAVRDYGSQTRIPRGGKPEPLDAPQGNMLILDLAIPGENIPSGNAIAVRPSGTEPKIKFYLFVYEPTNNASDLSAAKEKARQRTASMKLDVKKLG